MKDLSKVIIDQLVDWGYVSHKEHTHNFYIGKAGTVFYRGEDNSVVWIKGTDLHIVRDNSVLYHGTIDAEDDLHVIARTTRITG